MSPSWVFVRETDSVTVMLDPDALAYTVDIAYRLSYYLETWIVLLEGEKDPGEILREIENQRPKLILHNIRDKYNTRGVRPLKAALQKDYVLAETSMPFEIYRPKKAG